jgi:hypothetical protein
MGKDSFILTRDVVAALIEAAVVDRSATSKRNLAMPPRSLLVGSLRFETAVLDLAFPVISDVGGYTGGNDGL